MTTQDTEEMLAARKITHGEYADHAYVTQSILRAMMIGRNWETLPDVIKETLHMWAHKAARVVTGNPYVADHYADVAGYATLITQRLVDGVGLKPEYERPLILRESVEAAEKFLEAQSVLEDVKK